MQDSQPTPPQSSSSESQAVPAFEDKVSSTERRKPTSEKKIQANRRNARRSTGPRTARGKRIASRNSTKHGLCAADVVNPNVGEKVEDFQNLLASLTQEYQPIGKTETLLVEQIASYWWRLRRALRAENGELSQGSVAALKRNFSESDRIWMDSSRCLWGDDLILPKEPASVQDQMVANFLQSTQGLELVLELLEAIRKEIGEKGDLSSVMRHLTAIYGSLGLRWINLFSSEGATLDANERLGSIDREIKGVRARAEHVAALEKLKQESEILVCSVPSADSKVLRYEAHIDRLLHRAMLQLERMQSRRKGEPVPIEIARLPRKSPAGDSPVLPEASGLSQTKK